MHPVRKQRLILVCFIVVFSTLAVGLVTYGLRGNINLFFPPAEIAAGLAPTGQPIRLGGMVVEGSVRRDPQSLRVEFDVTDYQATVTAVYTGILPDLFSEGEGVVAAGVLDENGVLQATEVLAKHDENYMPPEVAEALSQAHDEATGS
ncbi:MAG: cytochrome c maturation protein CcmE [Halieaceae bacterium]|jgi:cytochrome c-type biogenesis protein CcmE|nr:cytochrome c maturation protein CcmE [Halieaceae bacterium]